ncbi:MAG: hypothetical protein JW787_17825 [Sedimentisphaerales bacterium]|nr:hypothetical protein [Sedimentisphaerales bacterium]
MELNNRITLYMALLVIIGTVLLPCAIAQNGGRGSRDGGSRGGDRGDMMGGGGRGGDRGDMMGGGGRGGDRGDIRGGGRGGLPFQDEILTDAQIDRIIKMYSMMHSPQDVKTLQDQRKIMSKEQFTMTLRGTAFFEYRNVMMEEEEYLTSLKWVEKFTPDEAKGIRELRDENYDLYKRRLDSLREKYRSLMNRPRTSDELMHVLVSDLQLELKERDLTRQYWMATDPVKKESISTDLKDVLHKRYDLIVKQKEIQYTDFQNQLKRLQESVDTQLKDINTWKGEDFKENEINQRYLNLTTMPATPFRRSPFGGQGRPFFIPPYPMTGTNTMPEPNSMQK